MNISVRLLKGGVETTESRSPRWVADHVVLDACFKTLRVDPGQPFGTGPNSPTAHCSAAGMVDLENSVGAPDFNPILANQDHTCGTAICRTQAAICAANVLLELAATVDEMSLDAPGILEVDGVPTFPPQDQESAVALSEEAFHYAAWAATVAAANLRMGAGRIETNNAVCSAGDLDQNEIDGKTYGESMAMALADAALVAEEAALAALEHQKAVADAEFARNPDVKEASALAWTDHQMSRARGAHIIAGGGLDSGIASQPDGACPVPKLSENGRKAVDLIRLAAPALTRVDPSAADLTSLWQDGTDSMRARLVERLGDQEVGDTQLSTATVEQFLASRDLSETDMLEARTYLKHEAVAFARDATATLPAVPLESTRVGGTLVEHWTSHPIYAATATEPAPLPAAYYRALTRFGAIQTGIDVGNPALNDGVGTLEQDGVPPSQAYARQGLAQLGDYVTTVAIDLSGDDSEVSPLGYAVQNLVAMVPGAVRTGGGSAGLLRLESCYRYRGSHVWRFRIYGTDDTSQYKVVRGVSGLRCAVQGPAEGTDCSLADDPNGLAQSATATAGQAADGELGYRNWVELLVDGPSSVPDWWFIVRRNLGGTDGPGGYLPVGGVKVVTHTTITSNWRYCVLQPVDKYHDSLVADAMAPSPAACGRPDDSCAGEKTATLIPLETELSSDGTEYESSWRVHLERARAAADRADLLGEQLIEAGLQMDGRLEAAEEDLEEICGAPISLADYFPQPALLYETTCPPQYDGMPCAVEGYVCRNERCLKDPMAIIEATKDSDPTAARLQECLGAGEVVDFVAVGEAKLCIWRRNDAGRAICPPIPENPGAECPYPQVDGACPTPEGFPTDNSFSAPEAVTETLGLFRDPDQPAANPEAPPPCDALRYLRDPDAIEGRARAEILEAVGGFFTAEKLASIARRVGWEARIDDYSAITLDGRDLYSTGDPFNGGYSAGTAWPCGDQIYITPDHLFYAETTCSAGNAARAGMNQRMGRAVLALRLLTGTGADGLRLPGESTNEDVENYRISTATTTEGRSVWIRDVRREGKDIRDVCYLGTPTNYTGWTRRDPPHTYGEDDLQAEPALCSTPRYIRFVKPAPSLGDSLPGIIEEFWEGIGDALDPDWDDLSSSYVARGCSGLPFRLLEAVPVDVDSIVVSPASTDTRNGFCNSAFTTRTTSFDWSYSWLAHDGTHDGLTARDVLDAMELACNVAAIDADQDGCQPPAGALNAVDDLAASEAYLRCIADDLRRKANRMILVDVPLDAIKGFHGEVLEYHGERGAASAEFASALRSLGEQERRIDSELRAYASDAAALRIAIRDSQISHEIAAVRMQAAMMNQAAGCLGSLFATLAPGPQPEAGLTCAQAFTQTQFARREYELSTERIALEGETSWEQFNARFRAHEDALKDAVEEVEKSLLLLRGGLAKMEVQRAQALRALGKASFIGSDPDNEFAVNTVMRRRYNTLRLRYEQARRDAIRLAWIARRAVEQRLGVSLGDLREGMTLVDAPAHWADALCTTTGIDYTRIRNESGLMVDDYAEEYIGDYVRKLELLVASYEFDFPFMDSQDTAVVSMRDDVVAADSVCENPVNNLLAYSAQLDMTTDMVATEAAGEHVAAWDLANCTVLGDGTIKNCITVVPLPSDSPVVEVHALTGDVRGYRVTFGPSDHESYQTGAGADSALVQRVHLEPGYYRLSWYGRQPNGSSHNPRNSVVLRSSTGGTLTDTTLTWPALGDLAIWTRFRRIYKIDAAAEYQVALVPSTVSLAQAIDLGAIMLEDMSSIIGGAPPLTAVNPMHYSPGAYVATSTAGIGLTTCADTKGSAFRGWHWRRGCAKLCPAGYGDCTDGAVHCYWELPFDITMADIEQGGLLQQCGFAYGNYNYRHDWIAVNLVGSGVRDCSASDSPATCYGSGNIPYTIEHLGPYTVRNHRGDLYEAPLFPGRIEHGRALAAERYVTNPISSSDRGLLEPYAHRELRGRPLGGGYLLRLWDADGFTFQGVEDVQLILGYRYWTRSE